MKQWLTNIRRLLNLDGKTADADEVTISTAAHPADEETEMLHEGKRRLKENYTSHWDLDYLPKAEVDRIMGGIAPARQDDEAKPG